MIKSLLVKEMVAALVAGSTNTKKMVAALVAGIANKEEDGRSTGGGGRQFLEFILSIFSISHFIFHFDAVAFRQSKMGRGVIGEKWSGRFLWLCALGSAVAMDMLDISVKRCLVCFAWYYS
ncbi:hypothetical protein IFM89_006338 [Coptis chinensis]|uniref:Uncharacterized protein n=1 Tax=Coptis chinensis TaxID=261450 RepID=A0A835M1T0_9MAGN|nr:hypothetical protein IFM89_006338 [Coptis chinensis]